MRNVGSDTPIKDIACNALLDAHRHADEQCKDGGAKRQFERCRHALQDQFADRFGRAVAQAEFALNGIGDKAHELDRSRVVESEFLAQRLAFREWRVLAHHGVDRIADITEQGKGNDPHRQKHGYRLHQTSQDES
jgi:hypothetical protein